MTSRALFARLLGALAAVPLVGKIARPEYFINWKLGQSRKDAAWSLPGSVLRNQVLDLEFYPLEYREWVARWQAYAAANPERIAAQDAERRRLFPILYADD